MEAFTRLPAATLLRAFYLAASLLILIIRAVPILNRRFLAYGSRAASPAGQSQSPASAKKRAGAAEQLLDYAASFQVPHNFFTHFYELSVVCSVFWGRILQLWNAHGQLQTVWLLMLLQGVRRFLESRAYMAASKSTMWFGHWLLGMVFYLTVNVAVWIEGVRDSPQDRPDAYAPSWTTILLVPAILTFHGLQHLCHAYLYRLRTQSQSYQLPSHPLFSNLICPHYTCEIAIYALLSFLAAPAGRSVNWTLASSALFVATNLGVTAAATKPWYIEKFGAEKVSGRWVMIPWVW